MYSGVAQLSGGYQVYGYTGFLWFMYHLRVPVRNGCRTCFPSLDVFAHRVKADQFAFAHLDEREVVFLKPRS